MSYGLDLGRLKTSSTGMSYVDRFTYTSGTVSKEYSSPAFQYATDVKAFVLPGVDIPASTVPQFPTVNTSFDTSAKKLYVTASGGNVNCTILVFVR